MDRLTPLDDLFITLERDEMPLHIGSLLIFDGPMPSYADVLASMADRLHTIPRYRQRIREIPLQLGLPVWQDDPHFNLEYHVRHTAVPSPGGHEQLRTLAGRLLSLRLDLNRSPWEMWLIDGLPDGQFAVLNKVHHSMVDGLSGSDLMEAILDTTPEPPALSPQEWTAAPGPSTPRLIAEALVDDVRNPARTLRNLAGAAGRPREFAESVARTAVGSLRLTREMAHIEDHLIGPPGPHRRWDWAVGDLNDVKHIKGVLGGTVNDVILTAIAGAFREFLLSRGVQLRHNDTVETMVPVSTRDPSAGSGGNQVAVIFAALPVGIADPRARYHAVLDELCAVKSSGQLESVESLIGSAVFVPPWLFAAGARLAARAPQPSVATITTNVPGPQYPLYLLGRRLQRMLPYVPVGMNMLTAIAIISYNGALTCGITADYDKVPDVAVLAKGIEKSLAELDELAGPED